MTPGPPQRRRVPPRGRLAASARLTRGAAVGVAAVQVVVGTLWWWRNLPAVPPYGDTPEYLRLSETLAVDEFRTVAYPAAVRVARELEELGPLPWQVWLYLAQTVLAVAAAWWVLRTLAPHVGRRATAFGTAVVVTSPLVLHYATSVLSDSAAASLFLVALAGAARIVVQRRRTPATWLVTALAAFGAAALRTEKATVLVATAALAAVVVVAAVRRRRPAGLRTAPALVALGLVLVLPAGLAAAVNDATQTADIGRTHGGPVTIAVSRVVWPHLGEIRTTLAPETQAVVTPQDAAVFDADYNNVLPMIDRLRALDDGGDAYTVDVVRAAARCCWAEVAGTALGDAAEYAVTPVTFLVEGSQTLAAGATGTATTWNITRMQDHDPVLSAVVLWVGFAALGLLLLAAALSWSTTRDDGRAARAWSAGLVLAGTVVNGCLFAVAQGADTNVRYGLANAMAITAIAVAWALFPAPRRPGRGRVPLVRRPSLRAASRPR